MRTTRTIEYRHALILGASVALVGLLAVAGQTAAAATPKRLGAFDAWSAYTLTEKKKRICYMHSEPTKSSGKYTRRGDTFLQVTHRPAEKITNEIGLTAGYSYKKDSEVEIDIDGKKFKLFTDRDGAWARDSRTDSRIVRAMMKGRQLIARGTSGRGTKTVDIYQLRGFTAGYRSIGKSCKVK